MEENTSLFSPTEWFLLCRSLPLASSSKIIAHGLEVFDQIDSRLQDSYSRWLESLPYIHQGEEGATYPQEVSAKFEEQFGIQLETKVENSTKSETSFAEVSSVLLTFPTSSVEEASAFLEINKLTEDHATGIQQLIASLTDWEEKKTALRQIAQIFRYGRDVEEWIDNLFEPESHEWLYFNVCLFVFVTDGWAHGLHYTHYLKRSYESD